MAPYFFTTVTPTSPPEDITNIAGHRVTTIPRTFTDIYARHGELEALAYLESALNRGHTKQEFQDYLTTHHGQWNTVKLQRILDLACYGIESVQETRARYAIITQLPTTLVTPQAVIPVPHRTIVGRWSLKRVDLLLDNWLVIEIDGHSKYIGAPSTGSIFSRTKSIVTSTFPATATTFSASPRPK